MKHPIQPLIKDEMGKIRFKPNHIVRFLLDAGPFDMSQLACMPFTTADREQFAQLIGYSLGGFAELPYANSKTVEKLDKKAETSEMTPEQIKQLVEDAANFTPERVIATALHLSGLRYGRVYELFDARNERDSIVAGMKYDILSHLRTIVLYGRTPEFEKLAKELMAMLMIRDCGKSSFGSTFEIHAKTPEEARRIEELLI